MNSFGNRLSKVLRVYPWYSYTWSWYNNGYVSEIELKQGINYLLKLHKTNGV